MPRRPSRASGGADEPRGRAIAYGRTTGYRQAPYWSTAAALVAHRQLAELLVGGHHTGVTAAVVCLSDDLAACERFLASCRPVLGNDDYDDLVSVTVFTSNKLRTTTDRSRRTGVPLLLLPRRRRRRRGRGRRRGCAMIQGWFDWGWMVGRAYVRAVSIK